MLKRRFIQPITGSSDANQFNFPPSMKTRLTRGQKADFNDQQQHCITNFFKLKQFKNEGPPSSDCPLSITLQHKLCKQDFFETTHNNDMIITSLEKRSKIQKIDCFPTEAKLPGSPSHRIELNSDVLVTDIKCKIKVDGTINVRDHKLTEYFPIRRSVRKTKKTVQEEKQRSLEDKLRSGIEDGLEVHNFKDKGRGVVATKPFNRGDFVVEYSGELLDFIQAKRREDKYANDANTGCYMYYFKYQNRQYCIDATAESSRLGRLINHSRNGNLVTRTVAVDTLPHLVLIAKDFINVGEELCYDYGDRSKESLKNHPWLAL